MEQTKKKNKILFISDHPLCTSGVGVQSRMLIEGLLRTGKYSFKCLGGAIKHEKYDTIAVNADFIIKPVDGFGTRESLRQLLITERPDAIVIFTDPRQFVWLWEIEDEIHQVCPIAYWHVWDNDPYPKFNEIWYESTDVINCLSYKTYEMVHEHFPNKTNYIPHAFPHELYRPLPKDSVKQIRDQHFGERSNWQIGLWVNRNATRKMPGDVLSCFKEHLDNLEKEKGHRNSLLIMHTDPNDAEGPNLIAVSEMLGIQNNVWFSTQKLDFNDMNILHNITDYVINISKAEGFGLSTMISLKLGKPMIALKTGGMIRQVEDWRDGSQHGVAIEPAVRMLVGSQMVPYIHDDHADKKAVTQAFMTLYNMTEEEKEALAKKEMDYCEFEFGFDSMIKKWDESLETCIQKWKTAKEPRWTFDSLETKAQIQMPPRQDSSRMPTNNGSPTVAQLAPQEKLAIKHSEQPVVQKVSLPNIQQKPKVNLDDIISVRSNGPKTK